MAMQSASGSLERWIRISTTAPERNAVAVARRQGPLVTSHVATTSPGAVVNTTREASPDVVFVVVSSVTGTCVPPGRGSKGPWSLPEQATSATLVAIVANRLLERSMSGGVTVVGGQLTTLLHDNYPTAAWRVTRAQSALRHL